MVADNGKTAGFMVASVAAMAAGAFQWANQAASNGGVT